jgi:hypothetical protein
MSRAYFECDHYKVIYSEDIISVGDIEYCEECRATRKVTRLPEGNQGLRVILNEQDIHTLKFEIEHIVRTSNMHHDLLKKLADLERIAQEHPIVIEENFL